MRHSTSKRLDEYKTCLRCHETFPNTTAHFYLQRSADVDRYGLMATVPRCITNGCHGKFTREYSKKKLEKERKERESNYGFNDNFKTYGQMIARIGAKDEPYYLTEDEMEYKAPSYEEIIKEYRL